MKTSPTHSPNTFIVICSDYYYAVAKDYEANLVAVQASIEHPDDSSQQYYLKHEQVDALPSTLVLSNNATHNLDNVILFRIKLVDAHKKPGETHTIQVSEHHKGRREPYPKVIRVYEKQKVELYESKYVLSVYNT